MSESILFCESCNVLNPTPFSPVEIPADLVGLKLPYLLNGLIVALPSPAIVVL